jgi:hypothetical protein
MISEPSGPRKLHETALVTPVDGNALEFLALFSIEFEALMFGHSVITVLVILACLIGLAAPVLIDAHHWWPQTYLVLHQGGHDMKAPKK